MKHRPRAASAVVGLAIVSIVSILAGCLPTPPVPGTGTGPFAIAKVTVPAGNGFGGGTIYYPTDTSKGTFGAVAVVPGFLSGENTISWYGPTVASEGFVVFTIATNSTFDQPASRGDQLLAALKYLTTTSTVKSRVDANRLSVMGWSMGGGGTLEAAKKTPALKAAVSLAGWNNTKDWSTVTVPTMLVGCQNDTTAEPKNHSIAFYDSLPGTTSKAYLEIKGGSHQCPTTQNATIGKYVVSWLKRFVDGNQSYSNYLCPTPAATGDISQYRSNCPY